jgi:cation transport regulator ChaB
MSSPQSDILLHNLFNLFINKFGATSRVPDRYSEKMAMITDLYSNDYTGLVSTIMEYMIHSGTVDFTFQTNDAKLRKLLDTWQKQINLGLSVDIQRGLKAVTAQYLRERWKSSFIGIKVVWGKLDNLVVPKYIYLVDGATINVKGDSSILGDYEYTLGKNNIPLSPKANETLIIRKPFNSWYDAYPDPYLIKKGVLYNALLKRELLRKQGDVLEAILPYMMAIKAGNDAMARIGQLPTESELNALADQVKEIKEEYSARLKSKGMIGAFPGDVSLEHIIPDITKFFNETIVKPIDRNILSGMGMIELTGFSKNREEAILNPKLLIEEIKEGVADWTLILEDIMLEFVRRNGAKLGNKNIIVLPGTIKSIVTDNMKLLARSAYDRGLISKKTFNEDYLELDFEAEVQQIDLEKRRNLDVRMFPPVIMNQDVNTVPDVAPTPENNTQTPEQKTNSKNVQALCKSCNFVWALNQEEMEQESIECPECHEIHLSIDAYKEKYLQAPYENINELPSQTNVLPRAAKKLFMKVVNEGIKKGLSDSKAFSQAWSVVKKYFEKGPSGKWRKKKKQTKGSIDNLGVNNE